MALLLRNLSLLYEQCKSYEWSSFSFCLWALWGSSQSEYKHHLYQAYRISHYAFCPSQALLLVLPCCVLTSFSLDIHFFTDNSIICILKITYIPSWSTVGYKQTNETNVLCYVYESFNILFYQDLMPWFLDYT